MGKTAFVLAALVLMAMTISVAFATEYQVKQDGSGDFTTIQAAIDAAVGGTPGNYDGDVISVYPGIYYENIYFDGKDISVTAVVGLTAVIDGGRHGPVVQFAGTEGYDGRNCYLAGFVITNGLSPTGGGIRGANDQHGYNGDRQYTQAEIYDCYIVANTAVLGGGGVSEFAGELTGCAIVGNACDNGYGGGFAGCNNMVLYGCEVSYNRGCYGGGFSFVDVVLGHSGNVVSYNIADYGGGFYCSVIRGEQICLASEDANRAEVGNCAYECTFNN